MHVETNDISKVDVLNNRMDVPLIPHASARV